MGVETQLGIVPQPLHGRLGFKPNGNLVTGSDPLAQGTGVDSRFQVPGGLSVTGPGSGRYTLATASEGYFNNYEASGRPTNGFFNLAGRLDVAFFEDVKVHLHLNPNSPTPGLMMGGWPSPDRPAPTHGWTINGRDYFTDPKFDPSNRGFPDISGLTADAYRNSATEDYHPRAQKEWIEVASFDYPLSWDPALREFHSSQDAPTDLMIVDVKGRVKRLTPGVVDIVFQDDFSLSLPALKVPNLTSPLEEAADAPFLSLSNALRKTIVGALDATHIRQGMLSIRKALNDRADDLIRPLLSLSPGLNPAIDDLYDKLKAVHAQNPGPIAASTLSSILGDANGLFGKAIQGLSDVQAGVGTVQSELHTVFEDVDAMLVMLDTMLTRTNGKRPIITTVVTQVTKDQMGKLFAGIADETISGIADDYLEELEPTIEEIQEEIEDLRKQIGELRAQVDGLTGNFSDALQSATHQGTEIQGAIDQAANSLQDYLKTGLNAADDLFDPSRKQEVEAALRERLTLGLLGSSIPTELQLALRRYVYDPDELVDQLMGALFQQINGVIHDTVHDILQNTAGRITDTVTSIQGLPNISKSIAAGTLSGSCHINGDALREIRLDAQVQMNIPDPTDPFSFRGFILLREVDSNSRAPGCKPQDGDPVAEITLGAHNVPLKKWLHSDLFANVEGKVALHDRHVIGIGGTAEITGDVKMKSMSVNGIGATMAFGEFDNYLAARAGVKVRFLTLNGGIFIGKSCTDEPLVFADADFHKAIAPRPVYIGVYANVAARVAGTELFGIPSTCLLRLDGWAHTSEYFFTSAEGVPYRFGGRFGFGMEGELLCVIDGRGEADIQADVTGDQFILNGDLRLEGTLGACPFCIDGSASVHLDGEAGPDGLNYHLDF